MNKNTVTALAPLAYAMALVLYVLPLSAEGRLYMALLVFFGWLIIVLTFRLANDPGRDSTYISRQRQEETTGNVYIVVPRSEPSEVRHYHDHSHTHRHIVEYVALPALPDYQEPPAQRALPEYRQSRPQTVTVSRPERGLLEDKSARSQAARVPVAYITPGEDY